jgi:hypothetical protein
MSVIPCTPVTHPRDARIEYDDLTEPDIAPGPDDRTTAMRIWACLSHTSLRVTSDLFARMSSDAQWSIAYETHHNNHHWCIDITKVPSFPDEEQDETLREEALGGIFDTIAAYDDRDSLVIILSTICAYDKFNTDDIHYIFWRLRRWGEPNPVLKSAMKIVVLLLATLKYRYTDETVGTVVGILTGKPPLTGSSARAAAAALWEAWRD